MNCDIYRVPKFLSGGNVITVSDVMDMYKRMGGGMIPKQAIYGHMQKEFGEDRVTEIVDAINEALRTRQLAETDMGSLTDNFVRVTEANGLWTAIHQSSVAASRAGGPAGSAEAAKAQALARVPANTPIVIG